MNILEQFDKGFIDFVKDKENNGCSYDEYKWIIKYCKYKNVDHHNASKILYNYFNGFVEDFKTSMKENTDLFVLLTAINNIENNDSRTKKEVPFLDNNFKFLDKKSSNSIVVYDDDTKFKIDNLDFSGDIIGYVKYYYNLNFEESINFICAIFNYSHKGFIKFLSDKRVKELKKEISSEEFIKQIEDMKRKRVLDKNNFNFKEDKAYTLINQIKKHKYLPIPKYTKYEDRIFEGLLKTSSTHNEINKTNKITYYKK